MTGAGGQIGEAFVRIKADLRGFHEEVATGVKRELRSAGTVRVPGTAVSSAQMRAASAAARTSAAEQVAASRRIRSAREQEARATVASGLRERRALEEQVFEYRRVARAAKAGSETQIIANRLAAESAGALGIGLTRQERAAARAHGSLNKLERGAIAGSGAFRGMGRNVAYSSLSFLGAYGFINVVKGALGAASDLNIQQTRSVTVFGRSSRVIGEWADRVGRSLGFSKSSALGTANAFGTMLGAMDVRGRQAVKFSEDLTRVAAAISLARGESDPERASGALRVALAGRGRALRQYGIILDSASVKAEAFRLHLVKTDVDAAKVGLARRRVAEAQANLAGVQAKASIGEASPLQVARAQDQVTVAQAGLKKALAGSTVELSKQAQAVAAHSLIMSQGQRFIDRYRASLDTAAGRSRRFHENISELKEELGKALYPAFQRSVEGINNWLDSIREGGSRHKEFVNDLKQIRSAARFVYEGLRTLARSGLALANVLGGLGNVLKVAAILYATNKFLGLAHAIRASRLSALLLGDAFGPVGNRGVTGAERMAGAVGPGRGLRGQLRLARVEATRLGTSLGELLAIAVAFQLISKHKNNLLGGLLDELKGKPGLGPIGVADQVLADAGVSKKHRALGERVGLGVITLGGTEEFNLVKGFFGGHKRKSPRARAEELRRAGASDNEVYQQMLRDGYSKEQALRGIELTSDVSAPGRRIKFDPARGPQNLKPDARNRKDAKDAGKGTADDFSDSLRDELAQKRAEVRQQLAQTTADLVKARKEAAQQIRQAVQEAAQAERDAVLQAKSNLNSLGSNLSSQIGELIDKQEERRQRAPSGPLAARLKRLRALIQQGRGTPAIIAEAKKVEAELNAQTVQQSDKAEKRKARVQRRLADLTDELNTGKISVAKFNREVTRLLRREGISYRAAGRVLGVAFADGFRVALHELRAQARALAAVPARLRRQGTGFETQVIRPLQTIREQERNIAQVTREQNDRIAEAAKAQRKAMIEAQRLGVSTARAGARNIVRAIHQSAGRGHHQKPATRDRPPVDLTDVLLRRVLSAERLGNTQERRGDIIARGQRGEMIRQGRRQTTLLERIAKTNDDELSELREVKHKLGKHKPKSNRHHGESSAEARRSASNNLLGG